MTDASGCRPPVRIAPLAGAAGMNVSRMEFGTRFGRMAIFWSFREGGARILRITLPGRAEPAGDFPGGSAREIDEVAAAVAAFLEGVPVSFDTGVIRLDLCPAFQRSVLLAEHAVPRGSVTTYSGLAARVGCPRGARAAGSALAGNPFPVVIPCHRAVRSDGSPGGYQGGGAMKRELLEMEGVRFDPSGRVVGTSHYR